MVPEKAPIIILDTKLSMGMYKNGKDIKHTIHITTIMRFVRNDEERNLRKKVLCEVGLQLQDTICRGWILSI